MADYISRYTGEEVDERLALAETALQEQAQADWEQTDDTAADYIKNKPTVPDEFIAQYGVTSYAEITAALNAGKTVTMNRDGLIYGYCGEDIRHSYRFAALLGGLVGQGEPNVSAQLCLVSSTDEWTNTYAMLLTRSDIVTSMDAQSTNTQIPGAKAVYDAIQAAGSDGAVMYDVAQSLNSTQKAQARTNIGAGTYSKPPTGIPASDLASGVIPDDYVSTSDIEEVQDVEATLAAVALRKTAQVLTAAEKAQVLQNLGLDDPQSGGTPQASVIPANGLAANVYYELGQLSADLTVTLDSTTEESGKLNIYTLAFSMGATARNVTLPSVLWPGGTAPTFEAGMSYEIQFVNGRGTFLSFE